MNLFLLVLSAAIGLALATYAQLQIPRYTATRSATLLTRAILIAVGIAFGAVAVLPYAAAADVLRTALIFLCAFGAVHFPAAFILFVKRERGSGKS
jgi:cytochrome bd-type quinol oxidase subunit 2